MGAILVFLQQHNGKLPKATLAAITCAQRLQATWKKGALQGVTLGTGAAAAAEQAKSYGFETVWHSEDAALANYLAGSYAQALKAAFEQSGADTVVASATTLGKDLMPRLAAQLGAGQASDITAVNEDGSLKRPMFAGNVFADVEITSLSKIITVRTTAFPPAAQGGSAGTTKPLALTLDTSKSGSFEGFNTSGGDRPELGDAEIVVSGGRALKSAETFMQYIAPLADSLGAAIGASRAAVDSGYAPNDWQVGQTGKVVAPNLYLAVGISGAIQHLAGMKDSKTIVAINKDAEAPIFEVADYGLVGDLFEVVPKLTEEIKRAKS